MTVETTSGGAVNPWAATYGEDFDDGLGDIQGSDLTIPRLQILHKRGTFKDSSNGNEFDVLTAIFLGVVKQRIMWDSEVDEGDKPQCKSPNYEVGYPQMRTDIDESKQFPWAISSFDPSTATPNDDGLIVLSCDDCSFKEWTKKGTKSVKPLCSEQWTMPLYYFMEGDSNPYPAIISFQRSGAKPAKTYAASFKAQRQPMFTVVTEVRLTQESRGTVDYCTPGFKRLGGTEAENWREYSEMYRGCRDMLHQAPRAASSDDDKEAPAAAAPAAAPAPTRTPPPPPARKPPSAAAATALPSDDPWATAAPAASAAPASSPVDNLPF